MTKNRCDDKVYGKGKFNLHSSSMKSKGEPGDPFENIMWGVVVIEAEEVFYKRKIIIWKWWCILLIPKL